MASHSATIEKVEFMKIVKQINSVYFSDMIGFCILDNHFHLLVKMFPGRQFTDEEIKNRFARFYGNEAELQEDKIEQYREKWSNLSELIKEIKQRFSKFYNKLHNRRGTLWGERFKSVIVEDGATLINCLAYIDLNPVRAGIVKRPEDYRWSSLGYHIQSGNRDGFLSTDFGLVEFNVMDEAERLRKYRRYVYEAGALKRPDKPFSGTIEKETLEKEREAEFNLNRIQRLSTELDISPIRRS